MKNISKIFRSDIKGVCTNFFALVIVIGICFLPALYAWFNIYANWDPYSNTGNIKIAVANLDKGWTNKDQETIKMGDDIVESLKEKDSIGWCFLDTEKEAIDGVESGDYYAAVVIDKDFTYSMYNAIADNFTNPKITYYENQKKNAVATKITDTAVSTLQQSINQQFIKAVTQTVFETTNGISEDLDDEDAVKNFINKMEAVNNNLKGYSQMIDEFIRANNLVSEGVADANSSIASSQNAIKESAQELEEGQKNLKKSQQSFHEVSAEINTSMDEVTKAFAQMEKDIEASELENDIAALIKDAEQINKDKAELEKAIAGLSGQFQGGLSSELSEVEDKVGSLMPDNKDLASMSMKMLMSKIKTTREGLEEAQRTYNNKIVPEIDTIMGNAEDALKTTQEMLTTMSKTMGSMQDIFNGVDTTIGTLNTSLVELKTVLDKTSDKLSETLERIDTASAEEQLQIIMEFLSGDPDVYGDFFSETVEIEANYIYEIENYGSGVAPFYSVLAIWVGMTILVSIVKVHAPKDGLQNLKPHELFLGRYLLFFTLSQIQAVIIVLGDLYLLKIQCLYPFQLWLVAAVASFAFSILIYALTIAFGDIGKAAAVVVMVIQIAGSGGTYPIEALPAFFRNVYIFFPFPYAINGMRECIGGMYKNTYSVCILQLLLFAAAGLLIGLVIRIPFMKVNHFIEERMEDTKML